MQGMGCLLQGRPGQAAHDSALVVAVFLHVREVVLQGLVLGLVVVTEIVILAADCFVPGTDDLALLRELVGGDLIDDGELALNKAGKLEFGMEMSWLWSPGRRPTRVRRRRE